MTLLATDTHLIWLCTPLVLLIYGWAFRTAPWHQLAAVGLRQHLWFGAIVALGVFWGSIRVDINQLFQLHPLLITSCTLIFGLRLALIAGLVAMVITQWLTGAPLANLPFQLLVTICLPAAATRALLLLIARVRIQNLFLYILGGGFGGGIVAMATMAASSLALLKISGAAAFPVVWENAYLFLLLLFPEGFCNGTIVSAMAVMGPKLVKTYDDDFYLDGKPNDKR